MGYRFNMRPKKNIWWPGGLSDIKYEKRVKIEESPQLHTGAPLFYPYVERIRDYATNAPSRGFSGIQAGGTGKLSPTFIQ